MLKDRIQELQNIIQQYSSTWSSSRDPKYSSRFMTKTEDGLWVYTMDIERKTRCMDPLFARAKLVIADPENVPHHQTSKFIVLHMDDIQYVQQHVSSTIAPEVYQRQDIWQETDSIVILYAHRYSILDWAFIWESHTCRGRHYSGTNRRQIAIFELYSRKQQSLRCGDAAVKAKYCSLSRFFEQMLS